MTTALFDLSAKHPLKAPISAPNKRMCIPTCPPSPLEDTVIIPYLLQLHEEDVLTLPKRDLQRYFLAIQAHVKATQDIPKDIVTTNHHRQSEPANLPPFLLLPSEVRDLIYSFLLDPPASTPIRGPHPRQLQTQIALSRAFAPSILRTNRQIFAEALSVFYGSLTQWVNITIDYNVWSHKVQRSDLLMSQQTMAAMRNFHINIHLGNEKMASRPEKEDSDARLAVVRKGVRKMGKWLNGTKVRALRISWYEPPKTYTWEQKRDLLDELRSLRPETAELGQLNWGLSYPGKKYQFREEYLKELEKIAVTSQTVTLSKVS
jgi:hypothetical protein